MSNYISMDIGGTFIKYGLMNNEFCEENPLVLPTEKNPERFLNQLIQIINERKAEADGVAISIGGFINPVTGHNSDYSVGNNFKAYNLKEELVKHTGLRVAIENDSNCAALAEMQLGAGRNCSDFCMVTLGTGIGGAIIHNRQLLRGRNFKAGEFGFTIIGREGHNRAYDYKAASATAVLAKRVSDLLGQSVDGNYVFDHLEDMRVKEIYEEWLEDLAMVIGNIAVSFDPEKVIIGGGISTRESFITDLQSRVYHIFKHLKEYVTIEACRLGNNAGKIGALINFMEQYENSGKERCSK
ncbi:ROK family protein [Anaerocolumna xylanovorans]|uniref:Sugar kinase of the NBD/HSP70 family, may contain an N-terminal HTH domain n=1 Tax=Anaerocolumna xylanovorans DSM 12503 TaxID=1121345 RepID=A0A1M7XYB9_9FIRM|nr:ROK family protein [Anaerocolumna xylanovorans]SHO44006.1 Sugar kinase of the NBD/HSP70 family, may contain an N-terminal HTH domain [Anaerocolumna xylanovorans DSM 12503]